VKDLYIKANELRREYKKCVYVQNGKLWAATGIDSQVELTPALEKQLSKHPSMDKHIPTLLKNFDGFVVELDRCFDAGYYIEDFNIILLADAIARLLRIGDVHYWEAVLYVKGKGFTHKMDVYDALPTILADSPTTLKSLVIQSECVMYVQDYTAIVIEDIAYVASNYNSYLKCEREKYPQLAMFGYIYQGELRWEQLSTDHFSVLKAEGGKEIKVLTKKKKEIAVVLRKKSMTDVLGIKKYPYPIAILEDEELSYYAKIRK